MFLDPEWSVDGWTIDITGISTEKESFKDTGLGVMGCTSVFLNLYSRKGGQIHILLHY